MNQKNGGGIKNRHIVEYLCNGVSFTMYPINARYGYDCNTEHPTVIWNIEFSDEIYLLNNESFGGADGRRKAENLYKLNKIKCLTLIDYA